FCGDAWLASDWLSERAPFLRQRIKSTYDAARGGVCASRVLAVFRILICLKRVFFRVGSLSLGPHVYLGPLSSISISFGASFSCAWPRDLISSTANPVT